MEAKALSPEGELCFASAEALPLNPNGIDNAKVLPRVLDEDGAPAPSCRDCDSDDDCVNTFLRRRSVHLPRRHSLIGQGRAKSAQPLQDSGEGPSPTLPSCRALAKNSTPAKSSQRFDVDVSTDQYHRLIGADLLHGLSDLVAGYRTHIHIRKHQIEVGEFRSNTLERFFSIRYRRHFVTQLPKHAARDLKQNLLVVHKEDPLLAHTFLGGPLFFVLRIFALDNRKKRSRLAFPFLPHFERRSIHDDA